MTNQRDKALREFRQAMKWIVVFSALVTVAGLVTLWALDEWSTHAIIATILGLFLSTLLGAGLFSLAFFSDKSGHDDLATARERKPTSPADRIAP